MEYTIVCDFFPFKIEDVKFSTHRRDWYRHDMKYCTTEKYEIFSNNVQTNYSFLYILLQQYFMVQVKFTVEQATKAQTGSSGIAVLFL
jgi:hypothetical protein